MTRSRRSGFALVVAALALGVCAAARAQGVPGPSNLVRPAGPLLFRIVLTDGTALASYGEFARVGDRLVFSMPIGGADNPRLQLVNLPASAVDWGTTLRYAEATRYAQYVATRAEADFAVLTGEMARALNEIGLASDPSRKLQIAEQMHRALAGWPAEHYGYRSRDIQEMSTLLDETISQIRAATGVHRFDISLVAAVDPPSVPLLPAPSLAQSIDLAFAAARVSDVPAERMALLATVLSVVEESAAALPAEWAARAKAAAKATLEAEARTTKSYANLTRRAMRTAAAAAGEGNVRAVERAIEKTRRADEKLGRRRRDEMTALLAALQQRLDSARRLRLMRDQWEHRAEAFHAYKEAVAPAIGLLEKLRRRLEDVRALAGPPVNALPDLIQRFERAYRQLRLVRPPDELSSAHATLLSAAELGQQAARTRERATVTGDVRLAWDASAAAAGSLMMLAQACQRIDAVSRPPELR